jgi:hypothetical protein
MSDEQMSDEYTSMNDDLDLRITRYELDLRSTRYKVTIYEYMIYDVRFKILPNPI